MIGLRGLLGVSLIGVVAIATAGCGDASRLNAGRTLGTYRAATAQSEQARLQDEQTVLLALREVSDALTALARLSAAETA